MKNLHLLGNVAATEEIVTTKAPLLFFIITPYLKISRNFSKKIVRPFNQAQLNEEVEELRKLFFLSLSASWRRLCVFLAIGSVIVTSSAKLLPVTSTLNLWRCPPSYANCSIRSCGNWGESLTANRTLYFFSFPTSLFQGLYKVDTHTHQTRRGQQDSSSKIGPFVTRYHLYHCLFFCRNMRLSTRYGIKRDVKSDLLTIGRRIFAFMAVKSCVSHVDKIVWSPSSIPLERSRAC